MPCLFASIGSEFVLIREIRVEILFWLRLCCAVERVALRVVFDGIVTWLRRCFRGWQRLTHRLN